MAVKASHKADSSKCYVMQSATDAEGMLEAAAVWIWYFAERQC